jgi:hypothetical protein
MLSMYLSVLAVAWMVRLLFTILLPSYAYSWDISSWEKVASLLGTGENPYATTTFLNWPPLWMILLYGMARVSEWTGLELITVIRLVLVAFESLVIVLTGVLLSRISPGAPVRTILLFGMALNPVAIFVICQHGNFDVIATAFVAAGLVALVSHGSSRDAVDWLLACLLFGLAILTKTYPVALTPLLVPGARIASWKERAFGGVLLAGPAALGMAVLYALEPEAIMRNVLRYRGGRPETFGLSGIAEVFDIGWLQGIGHLAGPLLVAAVLAGTVAAWWWREPEPRKIVLAAALILLAIPTLGPGFGAQYVVWFIAFFVAGYASGSRRMKAALWLSLVVSSVTYFILYGYLRDLGQFMTFLSGTPREVEFGRWAAELSGLAMINLPMFVCWVLVLVAGLADLRRRDAVPAGEVP